HTIRETSLTNRVNQENSSSSCNKSRICNSNPRTHTQTETQFPLTTHITSYTK
uniref:Uncharacterized protein n=1 Tax=Oryza brachyantha TaxID=4533 RepID=J3KYU9_ORYBR